jgi:Tfp pilus assembly protein PilN
VEFSPNLLPASLIEARRQRRLQRFRAIGIIVAVVPIVLAYTLILTQTNRLESQERSLQQQLAAVRQDANAVRQLEADTNNLRGREQSFESVRTTVFPWAETLTSVTNLVPEDVWFETVKASNHTILIDGSTLTDTSVPTLAAKLSSAQFLSNVQLPYARESSGVIEGDRTYSFEFEANVAQRPLTP